MLTIVYSLMVIVAIGLLIFVHELGHFLVAKKVGIRVEAFSLGFGPKIFGFTRGETIYKLCAIPLGGYVKMFGEVPGESDGSDPGAFNNKTIAQRAWVVSAGVIMNVIFAFLLFPIAFSIGVPFDAPVVGAVQQGGPAWKAGLRPGDEVIEIDGSEVYGFNDIRVAVAFSDEPSELVLARGDQRIKTTVYPEYDDARGFNQIGINGQNDYPRVKADSKLNQAGIGTDESVVAINGVDLRRVDMRDYVSDWTDPALGALTFTVRKTDDPGAPTRDVVVPADLDPDPSQTETQWWAGVRFSNLLVKDVAKSSDREGLAAVMGFRPGDLITRVNDRDVYHSQGLTDAIRATPVGSPLTVDVVRDGNARTLTTVMTPDSEAALMASLQLDRDGVRVGVTPGGPAQKAGLKDGDRIVRVGTRDIPQDSEGAKAFVTAVNESEGKPLTLRVERGGETLDLALAVTERRLNRSVLDLELRPLQTDAKVPFPQSIVVGAKQTWYQLVNIVMSLRSLITGKVAAKNMGGIISIAVISYSFAEQGLAKILFFMAILSLNLAILNILPIPVLDGGHLVFLALEKIKGGPLSDRAMGFANLGGLAVIVGLMVFVTFNDVVRHFF